MNQPPGSIVSKILDIISYQGDRKQFTKNFLEICYKEALISYIQNLPESKQIELKKEIEADKSYKEILNRFLGDQGFASTVSKAMESVISDYIKTLNPTLSQDQKDKLYSYLSSLNQTKNK